MKKVDVHRLVGIERERGVVERESGVNRWIGLTLTPINHATHTTTHHTDMTHKHHLTRLTLNTHTKHTHT